MMLYNRLSIKFFSILITLIPIALITGPFLPDLFIVIIGFGYLLIINKEKNFHLTNIFFFKLFFLIYLYFLTLSIMSQNLYSFKSGFFYFRFGLFSLALSYFINKDEKILKYLFYIFLLIYFALFFDSLFQFFFSKNIIGFEYINESNFRITSFFGKDEILGSYTARLFPFLLFLILWNSSFNFSKKVIFLSSIVTIISFSTVLISGERTSLGLFILAFLFIFFSSINYRNFFLIPLLAIIFIFFATISTSDKVRYRVITQTLEQMGLNSQSERPIIFSKTYEGHYKIAFNMFKEKPIIGHGPKMFRFYCSKKENFVAPNACTTHPHNFYAQALAETGIIGFTILLSIFTYIVFLFLKNFYFQVFKKKQFISDISVCLLGFYFMTLFPLLPSGNFFNNWLSILIYFPLGCLLYVIRKNKFYV